MGLGRRLALQVAAAVAVAIALAATATFLIVRAQLRDQIDDTLSERAASAGVVSRQGPGGNFTLPAPAPGAAQLLPLPPEAADEPDDEDPGVVALPPNAFGGPDFIAQAVDADGEVAAEGSQELEIPVQPDDRAIAAAGGDPQFTDRTVDGVPLRVLTTQIAPGTALQVARPLTEVNDTISDLLVVLALVTLGGAGAAALIGVAVGRRAARPIRELTDAAEEVASTHDLARRIEGPGAVEEIDRLRIAFNEMLAALEQSVDAQRSLVADASHELRTPLTSLRANIEVLGRSPDLDPAERLAIVADVEAELVELGGLVNDIVELARVGSDRLEVRDLRLDEVVEAAVARARRRSGGVAIESDLHPTLLEGDGERLDRAISNLLDNAIAWSPPGGEVAVTLADGVLSVRDQGPGIDAADLPRVFDRFYRAPEARGRPGSGLGLAIVQRVCEQHGAVAEAETTEEGGARLTMRFPRAEAIAPPVAPVEDLVGS